MDFTDYKNKKDTDLLEDISDNRPYENAVELQLKEINRSLDLLEYGIKYQDQGVGLSELSKELKHTIGLLDAKIDNIKYTFSDFQKSMNLLDDKIDNIKYKFIDIQSLIGSLEDKLEDRFSSLQRSIGLLDDKVEFLEDEIKLRYEFEIGERFQDIKNTAKKLEELEEKIESYIGYATDQFKRLIKGKLLRVFGLLSVLYIILKLIEG